VCGFSDQGSGALVQSNRGSGLVATSDRGHGVDAFSNNDVGIFAQGATFAGVFKGALVVSKGPDPTDQTIAKSDINGSLVLNDGNLFLNAGNIFSPKGTISCFDVNIVNADCAEEFELAGAETPAPGTVMCLAAEGRVRPSQLPYDRSVADVISGAGDFKPGILLDRQPGQKGRVPLALVGKVFCKVNADYASIEIGDLLTTSATPGSAMKAVDPEKAFGSVIGKALRPLAEGEGLIPILIALT
jgi:hypothetical protein